MRHRADIDRLRAVAVLPVGLFHAGFAAFGGSYIGVDVFFVISGHLITRIIAREVREERLSILNFYERRIRRIFPSVFSYTSFTRFPGWNALPPCRGAALILSAGVSSRTWTANVLSVPPLVWIGKVSYSLYLCTGRCSWPPSTARSKP